MEPKIIKTEDYIEFIGHYDDVAKCAKLSALASLYAVESKTGYAKFPIKYVNDINKALNCINIFSPLSGYTDCGLTLSYDGNYDYGIECYCDSFEYFTSASNKIKIDNVEYCYLYYNNSTHKNNLRYTTKSGGSYTIEITYSLDIICYTSLENNQIKWHNWDSGSSADYSIGDKQYLKYGTSYYYYYNIIQPPQPEILIGDKTVTDLFMGNKRVLKMYVGDKMAYEYQASNATITFNLSFTGLSVQGTLRFNFDTPFNNTGHCDWEVSGGWAYEGFYQYFENYTGNAPTMPSGNVFSPTSTFTIEVPIGTEIYVYKLGNTATLNGSTPSTDYTQATKITITQDTTFNISLSGEDD